MLCVCVCVCVWCVGLLGGDGSGEDGEDKPEPGNNCYDNAAENALGDQYSPPESQLQVEQGQ